METKKELKQKYKEMKKPMGIFIIKNNVNGKIFINGVTDVISTLNRHRFELKLGSHKIKELQKDWKEYGEGSFTLEVLEQLAYDKDEEKTDYHIELEILKMIWLEKLNENGRLQVYK